MHKLGTTPTQWETTGDWHSLRRGHMMTRLMAEDRPLWTGQVDLHGVNPEVWAQGQVK